MVTLGEITGLFQSKSGHWEWDTKYAEWDTNWSGYCWDENYIYITLKDKMGERVLKKWLNLKIC